MKAEIQSLANLRASAVVRAKELDHQLDVMIREAREDGLSAVDIAAAAGITRQRVYQIVGEK